MLLRLAQPRWSALHAGCAHWRLGLARLLSVYPADYGRLRAVLSVHPTRSPRPDKVQVKNREPADLARSHRVSGYYPALVRAICGSQSMRTLCRDSCREVTLTGLQQGI